jgi:hypothetical protein
MHKLDFRTVLTPTLLRHFGARAIEEAEHPHYYAIVQRGAGDFVEHSSTGMAPDPVQIMFGRDMLGYLNEDIHHDGAWAVAFTHPTAPDRPGTTGTMFDRFHFTWIDRDGDPQLDLSWRAGSDSQLRDFSDVILMGWQAWVESCEMAWRFWTDNLDPARVMELRGDQTIRKARGEKPTAAPSDATLH